MVAPSGGCQTALAAHVNGQRSCPGWAAGDLVTLGSTDTRETIGLDTRTQRRLAVLTHVLAGELTIDEAAAYLKLSARQVRRLLDGLRRAGAVSPNTDFSAQATGFTVNGCHSRRITAASPRTIG